MGMREGVASVLGCMWLLLAAGCAGGSAMDDGSSLQRLSSGSTTTDGSDSDTEAAGETDGGTDDMDGTDSASDTDGTGQPDEGSTRNGDMPGTSGAAETGGAAQDVYVCGDGIVDPGEACDDGNQDDSDGCTSACALASCGDGVVQAPEACDDGNASDTDACLSTCLHASCGDGFVQAGVEECDDGNGANDDACLNTCVTASCGDGYVRAGVEECDAGGDPDVYSCSASCQDQQVWYYWTFDNGSLPHPQACADFDTWRDALADDHTSIRLAGTFDEQGRFCNGPQATTLCNALRTGTSVTVQCDGHTWHVGSNCAGGIEVTADGSICDCSYGGYALRPCVELVDWGGIDTNTCSAPDQQIYIECGFD